MYLLSIGYEGLLHPHDAMRVHAEVPGHLLKPMYLHVIQPCTRARACQLRVYITFTL